MGNHEFCTGCHASDFHYGQTCQQAYPEGYKRVQKEKREQEKEKKRGDKLLERFRKVLESAGVDKFYFGGLHDGLNIRYYTLARANQKKLKRFFEVTKVLREK